jgi:Uma2 family endonuclease
MTAGRHVSVEEFEVMPLEGKWELIDGEVIELSLSAAYPSWVGGQIFGHLHNYVESHRAGWAFSANAGFVLFPDRATVRSPNAAFVTFDRLPRLTDHFVAAAPNIAAEVLSPWDSAAYMDGKIAMYLAAGTEIVWLVDPPRRTVTVFRPNSAPGLLDASGRLDGGTVLPGFSIPVSEIFD